MINIVFSCDNCGATREEPLKLQRKNEGYVLNTFHASEQVFQIFGDGWKAVLTRLGLAHYCRGCKAAVRLAVESDKTETP